MSPRRRRRVEPPPPPKHPYRDSLLMYLALAAVVVLVAWATGGELANAIAVAAAFFLAATGWTWWRFYSRIQREAGRR